MDAAALDALAAALARRVRRSPRRLTSESSRRGSGSRGQRSRSATIAPRSPTATGTFCSPIEGFISAFVAADPWFAGWCGVMVNSQRHCRDGRPADRRRRCGLGRGRGRRERRFSTACGPPPPPMACRSSAATPTCTIAETHLAVAVLGRAGARLLTSFDAKPGDALIMAIDRRGAYREPFDNFQAALEAPPERLRADLALLPELAERGLARAAKDISQGGIPGTAVMLAESSGVAIDARPRRHRAAAGRGARALAQDLSELRLSPVRRSRKCRARAFDCFARAGCTRLRSARSSREARSRCIPRAGAPFFATSAPNG